MAGPKKAVLTEEQAQLIAKALADPSRYEILKRIGRCNQASMACEAVRGCLEISPPTLSHHMKELETAGLISAKRQGKFVSYELQRKVLKAFVRRLKEDVL
jgi:ArsR family transcriptional regulator, arsenate/arsenite/antimonite-responsive transcriptional repressor